jgi:ferredoxin
MRVRVDLETCRSNGQCAAVAPDVFRLHEDGELELLDPNPPDALRTALERASRLCPTDAILFQDGALPGAGPDGTSS